MKTTNLFLKIITLILLTAIVDCHCLKGQDTENIKYDKSGNIKYLKFDKDKKNEYYNAPSSAIDFFSNILGVKEPNNYTLKTRLDDEDGSFCEIYTQTYNKILVEGSLYSLQFKNNKISKANGHFVKIEGIITKPKLTPEEASRAYSKYLKVPETLSIKFIYGIVIAEINEVSNNVNTYKARLCYKIDLLDENFDNGKTGYVDALSGEVLKTARRYNSDSAIGTFNTLYNTSSVTAGTQSYNNTFNLCDSSRGAVIHTWDLNDTYFGNYSSNRVEFSDVDNNWTTGEHSANDDQMAQDIHWGLQEIYDYFYNNFNFSSFDNNSYGIDAYAHAYFLDGFSNIIRDNAAFGHSANGYQAFFFGDGQFIFDPVASLDAVSHEYAHALTYNFTNLAEDDSVMDAINEGLSDIWGAVIEHSIAPNKDCWRIGEEIINFPGEDCIRNIEEPESITSHTIMADTYGNNIYNNATSFYTKSGIMSHWFYLLAHGGADTNDIGDYYCVSPLGIETAAVILFRAQTHDFGSIENYADARQATIDASNYWGGNPFNDIQVANAWYAVGVGNEVPTMIFGNDNMCSLFTDYTYSLPQEFAGETITWNVSGYPYIVSGQGTRTITVRSSNSGSCTITATYNHGNGNIIAQKTVWVGLPSISYITGPSDAYYGLPNQYNAVDPGMSGTYEWSISPYYETNYVNDSGGSIEVIYYAWYEGYYEISCTPQNTCGSGNTEYFYTYLHPSYFMMYPNPASNEVNITINEYSLKESDLSDQNFTVSIFDIFGTVKIQKKYSGNDFKIPINTLKDGNYFIRVSNRKITETKSLLIKH